MTKRHGTISEGDREFHAQVAHNYFRYLMPLLSITVLSALPSTSGNGKPILLALTFMTLLSSLVYRRLKPAQLAPFRLGFALLAIAFVLSIGVAGWFTPLPADPLQISVLYSFTPVTILGWYFLFYDRPKLAHATSTGMAVAVMVTLWRWTTQQPELLGDAPQMLFLLCLVEIYFGLMITQLNRQLIAGQQELQRDPLTGLKNRRAFATDSPHFAAPASLAILDIDHFKAVNDTYGHPAGDRVLRAVGDVMLDRIEEGSEVYRWGGEEFVVLFRCDGSGRLLTWLEEVRAEIACRSFVAGQHVTLSAGVSHISVGKSPEQAFAEADAALLRAKREGRNRVLVHSEG